MHEPHAPNAARCLKCGYTLDGLPSPGHCPECAHDFDLSNPRTFTRRVPFLRWQYWFPAWVLASIVGFASTAIGAFVFQNWGAGLWVGVPLSMGAIAGYAARGGKLLFVLLVLTLVVSFIFAAASMSLGGVFCALVLAGITTIPILGGMAMGVLLRWALKSSKFSQREYLPLIFLALIGPVWSAIEGPPPP